MQCTRFLIFFCCGPDREQKLRIFYLEFSLDSVRDIHHAIDDSDFPFDVDSVKLCPIDFKFEMLNLDQLLEVIKKLKNKNDFDGTDIQFVLDAWDHIGIPLLDIINDSLQKSLFWNIWKVSMVENVRGACKTVDFRPVNMMSNFEKIIEFVVKEQLLPHLADNDVLITIGISKSTLL